MRVSRIYTIAAIVTLMIVFSPVAISDAVPGAFITGYVLDEDGKPVPFANVTLCQGGQLWQQTKVVYQGSHNPQVSGIAHSGNYSVLNEGEFLFGMVYPGDYVVTAEKDGSNGTVNVSVDNSAPEQAVRVNITLQGYHVPTPSPELQNYTGAITGNIRTGARLKAAGVNISLWQDGRLVDRQDNPQASFERDYSGVVVDYLFEHLAPGNYTVMATYSAGGDFTDSVPVTVGVKSMRADIILTKHLTRPTDFPDYGITPTVGEFSPSWGIRTTPVPSPSLPWTYVLPALGAVAGLMIRKKDRR